MTCQIFLKATLEAGSTSRLGARVLGFKGKRLGFHVSSGIAPGPAFRLGFRVQGLLRA